jgi:hypothetical protein
MTILVTGAGGLIGSALVPALHAAGHSVARAVRGREAVAGEVRWEPGSGQIEGGPFEAVVHLAGESLDSGRWTAARRARAHASRVDATRALATRLAARAPRVLLCASAIGYYGDRADEVLDESSSPGRGFLAELVVAWEQACQPLATIGTRVVHLRLGLVLSGRGGALRRMLVPFRLGLGGRLGTGRQFWSWIALPDVLGAFLHALDDDQVQGPINVVAPEPVRQADFSRALGRVLRRPAWTPVPAFALRMLLGEMAEALVLSSARVTPRRLSAAGFRFRHPALEPGIRAALDDG